MGRSKPVTNELSPLARTKSYSVAHGADGYVAGNRLNPGKMARCCLAEVSLWQAGKDYLANSAPNQGVAVTLA